MVNITSVAVYLETFVTFDFLPKSSIEKGLKLWEYINIYKKEKAKKGIRRECKWSKKMRG